MLVINGADLKNAVGKFEAINEYLRSNLKQQLSDFTYNQISINRILLQNGYGNSSTGAKR